MRKNGPHAKARAATRRSIASVRARGPGARVARRGGKPAEDAAGRSLEENSSGGRGQGLGLFWGCSFVRDRPPVSTNCCMKCHFFRAVRGHSRTVRTPSDVGSHSRGRGFDSPRLHLQLSRDPRRGHTHPRVRGTGHDEALVAGREHLSLWSGSRLEPPSASGAADAHGTDDARVLGPVGHDAWAVAERVTERHEPGEIGVAGHSCR
jgi:hypothetical protein